MALDSTMTSGGAEKHGGSGVKSGGNLESPFSGPGKPGYSGVNAINDRNNAGPFSKPHDGGIPLKFYENISATPATLESTLEDKHLAK